MVHSEEQVLELLVYYSVHCPFHASIIYDICIIYPHFHRQPIDCTQIVQLINFNNSCAGTYV